MTNAEKRQERTSTRCARCVFATGAIKTHELTHSCRLSARRKAAVAARESYLIEMCSELAGVH